MTGRPTRYSSSRYRFGYYILGPLFAAVAIAAILAVLLGVAWVILTIAKALLGLL